ncbi:MAG TPA: hypothetical protein VNZ52_05510 [Candidatus Thermoplasmatota archaeon]|nr:hypothetical protein [Candidatus Thermoplasmatota archaeon]
MFFLEFSTDVQLALALCTVAALAVRVYRLERAVAAAAAPLPRAGFAELVPEPIPADILVEMHLAVLGLLPPAPGATPPPTRPSRSSSRKLKRRAQAPRRRALARAPPVAAAPVVAAAPELGRSRGRGVRGLRQPPRLLAVPLRVGPSGALSACPA